MNKINWKDYTKEDRKFLINLSVSNRDYLTTCANILLSQLIGLSAIMLSVISILISLYGIKNSFFSILIIIVPLSIYWIWCLKNYKKLAYFAKNFNKQYQEIHKTLYPEIFKGGYFY